MLNTRDHIKRETADCDDKKGLPDKSARKYEGKIEVLREESHADDIYEERDNLRDDHVCVPTYISACLHREKQCS